MNGKKCHLNIGGFNMSITIPTVQQMVLDNIARIEGKLNQNTPDNDKAFNKVIATMQAMQDAQLYRLAIEKAKQNLALTATKDDLDLIGAEYDVTRGLSEAAILTVQATGTNGTIIPINTDFVGDANAILYFSNSSETVAAGVASFDITSDQLGVSGNLEVNDTLKIGTQIAGLDAQVTVTAIVNLGVEEEVDDVYRVKILDEIRTQGGGGNTVDYRNWSQEVTGVVRAYPYSGLPFGSTSTSSPADRTVYVEADITIDPDGIAPSSMLDDVRDSITTDPDTGIARQPLGLTDDTLFVETINRLSIFVEIRNLIVEASIESQVKSDIADAVELYLRSIAPYIPGLDPEEERMDTITDPTVSSVVQDVVGSVGGSVEAVSFGLSSGTSIATYTLNPGELTKSGGIIYVTT